MHRLQRTRQKGPGTLAGPTNYPSASSENRVRMSILEIIV
jgi:hypothetical protein